MFVIHSLYLIPLGSLFFIQHEIDIRTVNFIFYSHSIYVNFKIKRHIDIEIYIQKENAQNKSVNFRHFILKKMKTRET